MSVTCEQLEPLLRGPTWAGPNHGFGALVGEDQQGVLGRAVGAWRKKHQAEERVLEADGHVNEVILILHARMVKNEGLARPEPCASHDPTRWLYKAFSNAASETYRNAGGFRKTTEWIEDLKARGKTVVEAGHFVDPLEAAAQRDAAAELQRQRDRILAADTPAPRKLAYVCLEAGDHLTPELVRDACSSTYQAGAGLTRDADATWELLEEWWERHQRMPDSNPSRRELAWIFRGPPGLSLEEWAAAEPDDLRKARDLLRTWSKRASKAVEEGA